MKLASLLLALVCCIAHADEGPHAYARALAHRNGIGMAPDARIAAQWMAKAAGEGEARAMFAYSNMLWTGEGVTRDEALSRFWLEAAAERELPEALQELALALRHGARGFALDEARAAVLFQELAHAMRHPRH
jgi:TPR repeat protein